MGPAMIMVLLPSVEEPATVEMKAIAQKHAFQFSIFVSLDPNKMLGDRAYFGNPGELFVQLRHSVLYIFLA